MSVTGISSRAAWSTCRPAGPTAQSIPATNRSFRFASTQLTPATTMGTSRRAVFLNGVYLRQHNVVVE